MIIVTADGPWTRLDRLLTAAVLHVDRGAAADNELLCSRQLSRQQEGSGPDSENHYYLPLHKGG